MNNTSNKPFYITTTLPYVNGRPHLGYALEVVQADVIARAARSAGSEVVFNIGTDEHGQKIYQKATEEGVTPQEYCDRMAEPFRALRETLDVSYTHFVRTTDEQHVAAAQEFWRRCAESGDIYKQQYQTKYCVGCEMEKTDSDLDHGVCPDHPKMEIELVEEENYFFRFSKYQEALLRLYTERPDFVVPANRLAEIKNFVEGGLQDFSISRLASKMPWGIPVPGDEEHVMYVWFDALVNYISTLGWPAAGSDFEKFWPGLQIAGKDNLRQQSAMWQAMLLSAGIAPSEQILIHGHIMVAGQKMSKSLGNVISPDELIEKFGKDGTRYLLLSSGNLENDPDITLERLAEKYNADLANGLGNLASRLVKLSERLSEDTVPVALAIEYPEALSQLIAKYRLADALEWIIERTRALDKSIAEQKPWELAKTDVVEFEKAMRLFLDELALIALCLRPFLPETGEKIAQALRERKTEPLFARI
ncbi:MAG: methionine--tRNA ligase [Candidatus Moranbacteria bacterium]|nr:methionine--tRNA ligase [Candidatus Moranbacteria bacterium]MBP6034091.1 methionine--tRNA ligase [Candidatus Moranbacteria bacterium]MBP7695843.1 methionine--tRNA ligase [Candidatus Moranbacteria bacterium]